ncbi:MAG: 2-methylcitrate synthase [Phycisphaerae bacterium]|nr:2-methylcitrate synthase [Phycisphaerae bacterium]
MDNATEKYYPGLEGVIAGETAISAVTQDSLGYRGYMIDELAEHATFEEVAWLLLHGELPRRGELSAFRSELDSMRRLPRAVLDTLRAIPPHVSGMEVLRTAVSMCGHFDPTSGGDRANLIRRTTYLLAVIPSLIGARCRLLGKQEPVEPKPGLSHAAQILHLIFGQPPAALHERLMNLTLILYAEHEFNASTFTARVIASTLSDMISAVVGAIGALRGPLHGGANEDTVKLINQFKSADEARAWTENAIATKAKISGFGHRVYKHGDHRARILETHLAEVARERNEAWRLDVYHAIKNTMWERKQIHMNLDYPCGPLYYFMNLPLDAYTPLFVTSRVSGWCAHVIEQLGSNRIIRPTSRYNGPATRHWTPLESRG